MSATIEPMYRKAYLWPSDPDRNRSIYSRYARWKRVAIGFVHRVVFALSRHGDVRITQHVGTHRRIEREAVHAVAGAVDQNRRRAVDDVAGRNLLHARLQAPSSRDRPMPTSGGRRRIENVVPTLTLTSIFEEPSSGSKTTA